MAPLGIDEVYNQQRLNDINHAGNKTVLTHVGLDVGEDGKTHQCIDYVGLLRNNFGWKLVVPADPNQTDRATRWMLGTPGCICLAMGRSKVDTPREHHRGTGGGPVLRPRGIGGRAVELFPSRGANHLACSVNHREVQ